MKLFIQTVLLSFCFAPLFAQIDADATYETKALYQNLLEVGKTNLLFGHQDATAYGVGWNAVEGKSDVKDVCGDYPAVYGWDIGGIGKSSNIDQVKFSNMKRWIREAYERGGINTISMHLDNPYTGGDSWDNRTAVVHILPGGSRHQYYLSILDKIAAYLKELKTSDGKFIPIVFRPYHEHTQTWSWWGSSACSEEEFIELWKMTLDYLMNYHNIHHLLYAISPQDQHSLQGYFFRYPGDDFVDVMGFDYYNLTSASNAPQLGRMLEQIGNEAEARGKIAAITETGVENIPLSTWWTDCLYNAFSYSEGSKKIAWALVWRNAHENHFFAPYPGQASAGNFIQFYNYSDTYFEADLPDMYQFNSADNEPPVIELITEPHTVTYDTIGAVKFKSNERSYFKYSFSDESYADMPHAFTGGQGGFEHSADIPLQHGSTYDIYIRSIDVYGNSNPNSVKVSITVDTTKLAVTWKNAEYIDVDWNEGKAPLGYNDDDLETEVSESRTIYLRKDVELPEELNGLGLLIRGHDGFIAYFNGNEIDRINMPASGSVEFNTYATSSSPVAPVFIFNETLLNSVKEINTIAVEVHRSDVSNPDISFDARLFNNEGFYIDLGSDWKYYAGESSPPDQVVNKPTAVEYNNEDIPEGYKLNQNYPNPFNPETKIIYSIPVKCFVKLVVTNMLGETVETLVNEFKNPGTYEVRFNADNVASGIYFYTLKSSGVNITKKMILIR